MHDCIYKKGDLLIVYQNMKVDENNADWNIPPPRRGAWAMLDKIICPGATPTEIVLQFIVATIAVIIALLYASNMTSKWSLTQYLVCGALAFDIVGGIISNATSSAKRWYHRDGQGFEQHFMMVTRHLVHLMLVSWLYLAFDIEWFLVAGGYLLLAAIVILSVPVYLQRPVSLIAYSSVLLLSSSLLAKPTGLEWFLPLFYLELLVSYLVKEEPYRPGIKSQ